MSLEADVNTIQSYLSAWPAATLRAAFKQFAMHNYKAVKEDGWVVWSGQGKPTESEWMLVNGIYFVREKDSSRYASDRAFYRDKIFTTKTGKATCPWCGEEAFEQPVCGKCAKGRAGIKKQYLCGVDPSHVFYCE